ncbi:MAG TPA: serine/threonine-protein kinase [Pilimelia sp.]|nr:serine/threonine-protein kinase [Pilimelia sp.]
MTQIPTWNGHPTTSGPASAPSALPGGRAAPGSVIGGRYALRAAIGHGGMGTVWRASDTLLRRDVAVKEVVLPPGLAPSDRDAMYERTLREARAAAALSHPAVVQVYDVVTEGGRPWIVMELLDARSLSDMVIEDGPLNPRAVAKIGIALLGALEVAHAAGVLHRDVKPANVLIASDGRCVLTDFGVARMPTDVQLTTPGMVLGSPHFISPERAMGSPFGPPSDLFSLGVTLYTAVEGRPPFDRGDPIETMHAVVEDPPAPPMRAGALGHVLFGLLEKDPHRRWDVPTARGLLRELLAGPLASKAPPHQMTDPYAVVPVQRAPVTPPPPKPTGQIGGRAMLAPGELPTDRITHRQPADIVTSPLPPRPDQLGRPEPVGPRRRAARHAAPDSRADAGTAVRPWDRPTGAAGAGPRSGAATTLHATLARARQTGAALATTVRGWPRRTQLAAAGVVAVVLLGTVLAVNLAGGSDPDVQAKPGGGPGAKPAAPAFAVEKFDDRGVVVNVPSGWRKTTGVLFVDFTDPKDRGRTIRILAEKTTAEPHRFMEIAEDGLETGGKVSCPKPYQRLDLRRTTLANTPAAELEYTCGEGDTIRHSIWRAVVSDGKAYSFRLTAPESRFAESRVIFEEMVRSFQLAEAG